MNADPYHLLRERILSGHYADGEHLPEVAVAAEFGLSRTPVRHALARLHAEGLVEVIPNRGARVVGWTAAEVQDAFEFQAVVESWGAARAARLRTAEDVEAMHRIASDMAALAVVERDGVGPLIADLNEELHEQIALAARNSRLIRSRRRLTSIPRVGALYSSYTVAERYRACEEHLAIVDAIAAGDPDAASSAMDAHISGALQRFLRILEPKLDTPEPA